MIIFIDGSSGAGKTTLAARLHAETGIPVVHLDDFYPGWHGLAAASEILTHTILLPTGRGFLQWDWSAEAPGNWVDVPDGDLIIEGSGSVTPATISQALALGEVKIYVVELDAKERKKRALKRDPDYAPFWDMWAEQECVHAQVRAQALAAYPSLLEKIPVVR